MDNNHGTSYAPRSPDLSAYHSAPGPPLPPPPPSSFDQTNYLPPPPQQQHTYAPAYLHAQQNQHSYSSNSTAHSPPNSYPLSPPRRIRPNTEMDQSNDEWLPDQPDAPDQSDAKPGRGRKSKKVKVEPDYGTKPAPGVEEGIEVKTKFPVARIKRIMQADEDVGKVAQVTPTAVSKALELFMISLVTKSAAQAKSKSSKKVTAAHLKQVIEQDEQFDFLQDITAKIPDAPTKKEKEEDSEGAGGEGKRKRAPRRKKVEDEGS